MSSQETAATKRRPGNSAGITRERIIAAARPLDPETLTIQAVATQLGVDRKAVTYHVTDRDGLMEILATDAFSQSFAKIEIPADASWQDAVRLYAHSMRDGLLASGPLVTHFRFSDDASTESVVSAELVMERMVDAGIDPTVIGRSMIYLANSVMSYARDVALSAGGKHPQQVELHRMVTAPVGADLTVIRSIDEMPIRANDDDQFEFILDVLIRGLDDLLESLPR